MARKIIVLCDICLSDRDEEVEAVREETITFGTLKPRAIAVCEGCGEQLAALKTLVTEYGQITESAAVAAPKSRRGAKYGSGAIQPNADGDYVCDLPQCEGRAFRDLRSQRAHGLQQHGMPAAEYGAALNAARGQAPEPSLFEDKQPEEPTGVPGEFKCDQPGCKQEYDPANYARPAQALAVHKARTHGISGKRQQRAAAKAS